MKKILAVAVAFFLVIILLVSSALSESWKPTAEISVGIHSGQVGASGALWYDEAMSNQSVMVGLDKNGSGLYIKAENFSPFEKEESRETDFYLGFYTEAAGMKFDVGYGHYWISESGELDYHAAYAAIDFPAIGWQIVPFVKAEYNFAKNSSETSMDGFMYYAGLRREFQLHERVNLITELGVGGNTGIYGMPAENWAFAREKLEVSIALAERWKLKVSGLTQQNLGKSAGIAANTDKLFVGAAIVWTF